MRVTVLSNFNVNYLHCWSNNFNLTEGFVYHHQVCYCSSRLKIDNFMAYLYKCVGLASVCRPLEFDCVCVCGAAMPLLWIAGEDAGNDKLTLTGSRQLSVHRCSRHQRLSKFLRYSSAWHQQFFSNSKSYYSKYFEKKLFAFSSKNVL